MKTLATILFALLIMSTAVQPVDAQTKAQKKAAKEAELKELINSKKFTFQAYNVYPAYGGSRYLSTDYDVRIAGDSVISYLPYFGEVYSGGGYNSSTDSGIKFTSTDFEYNSTKNKNGSWNIIIKPKDGRNATQLLFTIQANGRTDLAVVSQNRQRIRFDGYIKDAPVKK